MSEFKHLLEKLKKLYEVEKCEKINKFVNILKDKEPVKISGLKGDLNIIEDNNNNSQIRLKDATDPQHLRSLKQSILGLKGKIIEPILVYENLNHKKYVLNGVHRVQAFQDLYSNKNERELISESGFKIPAYVIAHKEYQDFLASNTKLMQTIQACLNDHLPSKPNNANDIKFFIGNRIKMDADQQEKDVVSFINENLLEGNSSKNTPYREILLESVCLIYKNTNTKRSVKSNITKAAKKLRKEQNNQAKDKTPKKWVDLCFEVFNTAYKNKASFDEKTKDFYKTLKDNEGLKKEKMFLSSHGSTFDQKFLRDFKENKRRKVKGLKTIRITASQSVDSEASVLAKQEQLWNAIADVYDLFGNDIFRIWCADFLVISPQTRDKNIKDISSWKIFNKEEVIKESQKRLRHRVVNHVQ